MGKCRKNTDRQGKPGRGGDECRSCLYYRGRKRGCSLSEHRNDNKQYEARRRERAALRAAKRRNRNAGSDE